LFIIIIIVIIILIYLFIYLIVLRKWTASKFNVLNSSPFETLHATFQSTPSPVSYLAIA